MSFIRTWENFDLSDIKKHLLVVGELSAECFNCHKVGIGQKARSCPECGTVFKYLGFRRKLRAGDFKSLKQERAGVKVIDFFDFKKALSKEDAHNLFK